MATVKLRLLSMLLLLACMTSTDSRDQTDAAAESTSTTEQFMQVTAALNSHENSSTMVYSV